MGHDLAPLHEALLRTSAALVILGALIAYWRERLQAKSAEKRIVLGGFAVGFLAFLVHIAIWMAGGAA